MDSIQNNFDIWIKMENSDENGRKLIRNQIIEDNLKLVKIITSKTYNYFGGAIEFEELESNGILGLIDAVDKFDYRQGIKFETYASFRIRGTIIDSVRKIDWVPRTLKRKAKELEKAKSLIISKGEEPTTKRLVEVTGFSPKEIRNIELEIKKMNVVSLDDIVNETFTLNYVIPDNNRKNNPEEYLEDIDLQNILEKSIETLDERKRKMLNMYFIDKLSYKEVGEVFGVSESRAYQIVNSALSQLRKQLEKQGISRAS